MRALLAICIVGLAGCASLEELGRRAADAAADTVREDLPRVVGQVAEGALSAGLRGDPGGAVTALVSGLGALGLAFLTHWRGRSTGERKGRAYERNDLIARKVLDANTS